MAERGGDDAAARVFLVGMMGCGKSVVGRRLANELGVAYLDNDGLLSAHTGAGLVEVAARGADVLHRLESAIATELTTRPPPFVASVASSVAEDDAAMARLVRAGVVIYLRAQAATLLARVRATARPWLADDPEGFIATTLARRGPAFEAAAARVVDTDTRTPDVIAAELARWIRTRRAPS